MRSSATSIVTPKSRLMQRSHPILILRIHICTFSDQQFGDFFVTTVSRIMQRSPSTRTLLSHIRLMQRSPSTPIDCIHISTSSQVLFDGFDVSGTGSFVKIRRLTTPHQHYGCDCCE